MKKNLTAIIPAYNEEKTIGGLIDDLKKELSNLDLEYEIIVVNDASTDKTKEILEKTEGIKLINHPYNKGYGASLKTGIKNARYDLLLFIDGDGQHPIEEIPNLLKYADEFDMVTGARIKGYKGPYMRRPGKKLLHFIAKYLTGVDIPDLNCGFRMIKKGELIKILHLLPSGFSFSTTSILAFAKDGLNIKSVPIEIKKRQGKSMVKPKDALRMLLLILRIVLLFSPLKVFLPVSVFFFICTILSAAYDLIFQPLNITDTTILFFVSFILIFFFGLIADQLAAIRRQLRK